MFVLSFSFENHKSFRNEVDLTMVQPRLDTMTPKDGTWLDYTTRVAAIYGPNASGKSAVLDALRYMLTVIGSSASSWADTKRLPRSAFALDEDSRSNPSSFSLDFVIDDTRYQYGFILTESRIDSEWLYTFPKGRKRIVYERDAKSGIEFGRAFGPGGATLSRASGERELVLSKAALLKHPFLTEIRANLLDKIQIASFGETARQTRLRAVIEDVADGSFELDDLRTMLRVADVGISGAEVAEEQTDPQMKKILRAIFVAQREIDEKDTRDQHISDDDVPKMDEEEFDKLFADLARNLMFQHLGANSKTYPLASSDQSTGTLTWLSLAAPAIKKVREGGVLVIDELDASLHPQLAQVIIQMFRDPSVNSTGAQLIFTTHDTFFMSPASDVKLTPDEVWFVEKGRDGISDLFRLSDFPVRSDQNVSRRYLQGRYGAVPSVAPSFLAALAQHGQPVKDELELV